MSRYYGCALAAAFFATGCEVPATQELLELTVLDPGPVRIDAACTSGCDPATLGVEMMFQAHPLVNDQAVVEIVQYKVEYELDGVSDQVPYFAAYANQLVPFGNTSAFTVQLVGDAQRAWVRPRLGGNEVAGTARIIFAGYDHKNAQVRLETDAIDVVFGAYQQDAQ